MERSDWVGLGVSLALHLLLLLLLAVLTSGAREPEPLGYIEVDFGPLAEGRPVRRTVETQPNTTETPPEPEPPTEVREPPKAPPPEEAKPVDLPDQPEEIRDEETVETPETDVISPEKQDNQAQVEEPEPQAEPEPVRPLGGGSVEGNTGAEEGDDGEGQEEQKTAPFQIEGLNRVTVFAPLPQYADKVNATIRIRIMVDPQGRVVQRIPLIKGNPALEQAVMDVLQRWRFNPLPTNAPQDNQSGIITFRFRLE